nr:PREDICTED: arrestin homolog isoform X2 [Tribolium castaneum]|eukprot:XP_015839691.1 PREDICTED: arrestin homolog isoform X2 [Tribolium castaneum]
MYLSSRDLVVSAGRIDRLQGVLLVDPEFVENRKVYGQVTLTFRYGREDEEVMGLKFCNEAIMCLAQLYPPHPAAQAPEGNTPLQDALLKRLGSNAYPFSMEITPLAPPSVQLVPAKEYNGAPIGTSYDVRAYVADRADEKFHRKATVRMGIRVVQRAYAPPSPHLYNPRHLSRSQNKKTLFGCKSAPLDVKFPKEQQNKARSMETGLEQNRIEETPTHTPPSRTNLQVSIEYKNEKNETQSDKETHVSFGETITNGIEQAQDENDRQESPTKSHQQDDNEQNIEEQFRSLCGGKRPSLAAYLAGVPAPCAQVEKPFLLSEGKVHLLASLDKAIYSHGEEIHVFVQIKNNSNKTIRRIKVFVVQHVDVCMFSNGKFKNVVAMINSKENCPITSNTIYEHTFSLLPVKSSTKNWIALEDSYTKQGTSLASTVTCSANNPDERNVFAIYVSYYVKIKLLVSVMGGEVSLKLPFTLMHTCSDFEHTETLIRVSKPDFEPKQVLESVKDGT